MRLLLSYCVLVISTASFAQGLSSQLLPSEQNVLDNQTGFNASPSLSGPLPNRASSPLSSPVASSVASPPVTAGQWDIRSSQQYSQVSAGLSLSLTAFSDWLIFMGTTYPYQDFSAWKKVWINIERVEKALSTVPRKLGEQEVIFLYGSIDAVSNLSQLSSLSSQSSQSSQPIQQSQSFASPSLEFSQVLARLDQQKKSLKANLEQFIADQSQDDPAFEQLHQSWFEKQKAKKQIFSWALEDPDGFYSLSLGLDPIVSGRMEASRNQLESSLLSWEQKPLVTQLDMWLVQYALSRWSAEISQSLSRYPAWAQLVFEQLQNATDAVQDGIDESSAIEEFSN